MPYCVHCRVNVRGDKKRCVLCGNTLIPGQAAEEAEAIFPEIPLTVEKHLAVRLMVFISIVAIVASFSIWMLFPTNINWPIFVLLALVSIWLNLIFLIRKRHSIPKTIVRQVVIVAGLSLFWDWETGWRGWSLDYFIPGLFVTALLVMYITAKIFKLSVRDYLFYAMISSLFGIVPIAFLSFRWVNLLYPSILCTAISIIFFAAIFIFEGDNIKSELNKRMHI